MINRIEELLEQANVQIYKINRIEVESFELFFIKDKLETTRATKTQINEITVFVKDKSTQGSAVIKVNDTDTDENILKAINGATYGAGYVKNPIYELWEKQEVLKGKKSSNISLKQAATKVANAMLLGMKGHEATLNANEIFVTKTKKTLKNSKNVEYSYDEFSVKMEIIPTLKDVEIYDALNYGEVDTDRIKKDVDESLKLVEYRYEAKKIEGLIDENTKVVLLAPEIATIFKEYIADLKYANLYSKINLFKIGDDLKFGEKVTLKMKGMIPGLIGGSSVDNDLVKTEELMLIENNKVKNNFGRLQYASYLKVDCKGNYHQFEVSEGSLEHDEIIKDNTMVIYKFSGLQTVLSSDYLGGEVRLALFYKDGKIIPLTGFSISAKLSSTTENMKLSKELCKDAMYHYYGPKYLLMDKCNIN